MNYFSPSRKILKYINEKYDNLINCNNSVACHVRRGDYVQLSEYHHNLTIEYYKQAIATFDEKEKLLK